MIEWKCEVIKNDMLNKINQYENVYFVEFE